jgi:hypothetical protein
MSKKIYKDKTKVQIIDALVERDLEVIRDDPTSIEEGLRTGITGYSHMTDSELIELYQTHCEED